MDQHLNLNIFYNSAARNVCSALSENVNVCRFVSDSRSHTFLYWICLWVFRHPLGDQFDKVELLEWS